MSKKFGHWTTAWEIVDVVAAIALVTVVTMVLELIETGVLAKDTGLTVVLAAIPVTICADFLYSDWATVRLIRIVHREQARRITPHGRTR